MRGKGGSGGGKGTEGKHALVQLGAVSSRVKMILYLVGWPKEARAINDFGGGLLA